MRDEFAVVIEAVNLDGQRHRRMPHHQVYGVGHAAAQAGAHRRAIIHVRVEIKGIMVAAHELDMVLARQQLHGLAQDRGAIRLHGEIANRGLFAAIRREQRPVVVTDDKAGFERDPNLPVLPVPKAGERALLPLQQIRRGLAHLIQCHVVALLQHLEKDVGDQLLQAHTVTKA